MCVAYRCAQAAAPSDERPVSLPLTAISIAASASASGHCPICRNLLIERCINCAGCSAYGAAEPQLRQPGAVRWQPHDSCSLAFGRCGCVFHHHCLEPWTLRHDCCPVHEVAWQEAAPSYGVLGGNGAPAPYRAG